MTWFGHEFLDASREPKRWEKAKEIERIPIGIFYRAEKEVYEKQLLGDKVLVDEKPIPSVQGMLKEFM